jgi:hypothetical protein
VVGVVADVEAAGSAEPEAESNADADAEAEAAAAAEEAAGVTPVEIILKTGPFDSEPSVGAAVAVGA